jgi:hypothetical protein
VFGKAASALVFVMGRVATSESPEMRNHHFPVRHPIYPDLPADTGSEDLLGAPASDAKNLFECGAVDPRIGQGAKVAGDGIEVAAPGRFIGHGT